MSELSLPGGYYKSFKLPEFAIQIKELGDDALDRFEQKRDKIRKIMQDFRSRTELDTAVVNALEIIDQELKEETDD